MGYIVDYPPTVTTAEVIAALRLHAEEFAIPPADLDRLERQITEQRAKREAIH